MLMCNDDKYGMQCGYCSEFDLEEHDEEIRADERAKAIDEMEAMKEAFARYVKEQFGCDILLQPSSSPDTFESIFSTSFIKQNN